MQSIYEYNIKCNLTNFLGFKLNTKQINKFFKEAHAKFIENEKYALEVRKEVVNTINTHKKYQPYIDRLFQEIHKIENLEIRQDVIDFTKNVFENEIKRNYMYSGFKYEAPYYG
ncbi:hypothetical protein A3Q56_02750 [Intoshia linei]|uniref:Uncharacterized protein n=1 Tax=Intoshia linei TaxID=1819745 RepID=A0A177B7E4_9BILA|nr:hypothetical protein A3Q56_02750 [Intoshia linei]